MGAHPPDEGAHAANAAELSVHRHALHLLGDRPSGTDGALVHVARAQRHRALHGDGPHEQHAGRDRQRQRNRRSRRPRDRRCGRLHRQPHPRRRALRERGASAGCRTRHHARLPEGSRRPADAGARSHALAGAAHRAWRQAPGAALALHDWPCFLHVLGSTRTGCRDPAHRRPSARQWQQPAGNRERRCQSAKQGGPGQSGYGRHRPHQQLLRETGGGRGSGNRRTPGIRRALLSAPAARRNDRHDAAPATRNAPGASPARGLRRGGARQARIGLSDHGHPVLPGRRDAGGDECAGA